MGDGTLVFLRELIEPDEGILGNQDEARHPVFIFAEALVLGVVLAGVSQHGGLAAESAWTRVPNDFFPDKVDAAQDSCDKLLTKN